MTEAKHARSSGVRDDAAARRRQAGEPKGRGSLHRLMQRRSTIAFLMTLPLLTLIVGLVP